MITVSNGRTKKRFDDAWLPYIAAAAGNIIWGFSNTLTQVAISVAVPQIVLAIRFLSAIFVMSALIILGKETLNLRKPCLNRLLALGVIELVYFYCESYGIVFTNVTCSGVILAVSPIISTLFAAIFLREIPTKKQIFFSIVAVAGVIMITVSEGIAGEIQPVGIVLLMGGCICSAVFRVINRSIAGIYSAFERTYVVLFVSGVAFSIAGIIHIRGDVTALAKPLSTLRFWIPVLALGICSSVGANMLANYAAEKLPVVKISVFGAICTICSMTGGILFLHEPVTLMTALGAVFIVFGIWQVNKNGEREG
ncbi:MAG: DMT family transporter [Lachnospiraceae bacterium]|nr:DMT family transporter [Lachnospiraceae bacterium]